MFFLFNFLRNSSITACCQYHDADRSNKCPCSHSNLKACNHGNESSSHGNQLQVRYHSLYSQIMFLSAAVPVLPKSHVHFFRWGRDKRFSFLEHKFYKKIKKTLSVNGARFWQIQYSIAQYSTAQYSTAQYSMAQYSTARHSTAQHRHALHSQYMYWS